MAEVIRILHLEQNEQDAALIRQTLDTARDRLSFTVHQVTSREQFLEALGDSKIDLVLSAYRTPGFSGEDALQAAQRLRPDVPFIMVTGELGEERVIETLQRGATDYVLKDRLFRLVPAIQRAIAEASVRRARAEVEASLRVALERTSEILNSIQDPFIVVDDQWRFVYVNQKAVDLWGKGRDQVMMHSLWELFPEARRQPAYAMLQDAMRTRTRVSFETWGMSVNRWIECHAYPAGTGGLSLTFRDISERKQRTELLREQAALIDLSPDAIIVRTVEGEIVFWNKGAESLYGWTAGEAVGRKTDQLLSTRFPLPFQQIMRMLEQEGHWSGELIHRTRAGQEVFVQSYWRRHVRSAGAPWLMESNVDITEQKRMLENLRESEQRFRLIADTMPVMVWTALPDGTIDYGNRHSREYSGLVEAAPGEPVSQTPVHPEDQAATEQAWQKALHTGEPFLVEHRLRRADGSYRWHLSRALPVRSAQGRIIKWYGTATDVHEIRAAHDFLEARIEERTQDLARANRELERANRELESFSYTVSHDLKAPLRVIDGFAHMLEASISGTPSEEQQALSPQQRDYVQKIRTGAKQMTELVNSLLTFSRVSTRIPRLEQVSMQELVDGALQEQRQTLGEAASAVEVRIGELPAVTGDPVLLRQVVANLLSNAFKFTRRTAHPLIEVGSYQLNEDLIFYVRDNGAGFPAAQSESLFQVFTRLHSQQEFEGTGIGLANVRKIIERHGGAVCAEGKEGGGATFYFTLPAAEHSPT